MSAALAPDVLILGGGLAGLSLALQLRAKHPQLRLTVLERRRHPVPEAAFKVGESTVEIGAHYFADVLGLRPHLRDEQIVKFGFRFFFSDGQPRLDRCDELGASRALPTGAWQLDRGRFENFLAQHAAAQGIAFIDGATVRRVTLADDDATPHQVEWERDGARQATQARWVVDASGRAGLLKRQLGLAQDNGHKANAVWFRIDARIDIDAWSDDAAWRGRCEPPERWRSTNHLVGDGYWVWLIPLASGSHSVGIVCDAVAHPLETMNSFERAMQWLQRHQPQLAAQLEPQRDRLQDFAFFRHFSYGCRQVFSPRRWALTGEAGLFLDPFYSPGSDFIAISNSYIATLIGKDLAGEHFQPYAAVYEQLYFSFYESTLVMYEGQYHLFGDPRVLPLKVLWDYTYYWGVLAALWFGGRIAELPTLSRLRPELAEAKALNVAVQRLLRDWGHANRERPAPVPGAPRFLDQARVDWFAGLNRSLQDAHDEAGFRVALRANVQRLRDLARELQALAQTEGDIAPDAALAALLDAAPAPVHADLLRGSWIGHEACRAAASADRAHAALTD
jgi:flavin-dependent dehydrogenase